MRHIFLFLHLLISIYASSQDMVFVKGGTFEMGSKDGERDETIHTVTLNDYYIGRYEVTFEEYSAFCTATSREQPKDEGWGRQKRPVINVNWYDAIEYCNWLSQKKGLQIVYTIDKSKKDPNNKSRTDDYKWVVSVNWVANGYRLPTEAEWEYAARSRGKDQKWAGTSEENSLASYGNYSEVIKKDKDSYKNTAPVGSFRANDMGLFDMSGNVVEWSWDWYDPNYYSNSSNTTNPRGSNTGFERTLRGGSWFHIGPTRLSCSNRYHIDPDHSSSNIGFRISRASY